MTADGRFRILVPIGCRSDEGLSAPVIRRLKEADWCEVNVGRLVPQDFPSSYMSMVTWINTVKPDLVLITGDRVEMCAAAAAAFHKKVKISHLYAGIWNNPITTFDDVDRHTITLWSDIQMCENDRAALTVKMLKSAYGIAADPDVVGITHLDDLEIDESKVLAEPYNLVLLNHEPLSDVKWERWGLKDDILTIQISGNPDGQTPKIPLYNGGIIMQNIPRAQFLGLLKNCRRFITNSSAAIYEALYFLKPEQIVMVGQRNRNRPAVECKPGGSDRVVEVLRQYALDRSRD